MNRKILIDFVTRENLTKFWFATQTWEVFKKFPKYRTDFAKGGVTSSSQLLIVSANAAKRLLWDFVCGELPTSTISQ